jgi:hypothetical protein
VYEYGGNGYARMGSMERRVALIPCILLVVKFWIVCYIDGWMVEQILYYCCWSVREKLVPPEEFFRNVPLQGSADVNVER